MKMKIYIEGGSDTYNGNVTAWGVGIHYQVARIGTLNKAPNFYV